MDTRHQQQESVNSFWFGQQQDGFSDQQHQHMWFQGGSDTDALIKSRFSGLVEKALNNELSNWQAEPNGCLALILLLDQFTRNIYRNSSRAFAGDPAAQKLSKQCIAMPGGTFSFSERQFIYMPLMHSEKLSDQKRCLQLFLELQNEVPEHKASYAGSSVNFAHQHYELIKQFGRFPYRNKVLGRKNTPAEENYLKGDFNSFGQ